MTQHKQYDHYVDVSGLHCPQPVINCKATLAGMANGKVLKFVASDHSSLGEIPRLVASLGDELLGVRKIVGRYQYIIRRRGTTRKGRRTPASFLELTGLATLVRLISTGKLLEAC